MMACYEDVSALSSGTVLIQTTLVTLVITCVFMATKTSYDTFRQHWSRATVVVVGAGPVGLTSVLISALSGKAEKIILFDEKFRNDLINRPQQIALKERCVKFLKTLGVDFDNIEGCWHQGCFYTRLGVFEEYMLGMVYRIQFKVPVDVRLNTKVSVYIFVFVLCALETCKYWLKDSGKFDVTCGDQTISISPVGNKCAILWRMQSADQNHFVGKYSHF